MNHDLIMYVALMRYFDFNLHAQGDSWEKQCQRYNKQCSAAVKNLESFINNPPKDNTFEDKKSTLIKIVEKNLNSWKPWGTGYSLNGEISSAGTSPVCTC